MPCEPGRGQQLRAGARAATGEVLLFLHADVAPPRDLADQISGALKAGYAGGNFRLRYPDRSRTVSRAIEVGLSVYEGEAWYDVDEPEDLRLEEDLRVRPESAPRTAEVVGGL